MRSIFTRIRISPALAKVLAFVFILMILAWGGATSRENELVIGLNTGGKRLLFRQLHFYSAEQTRIKRQVIIPRKNFKARWSSGEFKTTFWFDPSSIAAVKIRMVPRHLNAISNIWVKGRCYRSEIAQNPRGKIPRQMLIHVPFLLRNPLKYSDLILVVVCSAVAAVVCFRVRSVIKDFYWQHIRQNRRPLFASFLITLAIAVSYIFFNQKSYAPFSLRLTGEPRVGSALTIYVDSGNGFNDFEKFHFYHADEGAHSESDLLEIVNTSPDPRRQEAYIDSVEVNGFEVPAADLTVAPGVSLSRGNIFISPGSAAKWSGRFSSLSLGVVKHPSSGELEVRLNGKRLVTEDLYSSIHSAGYKIQIQSTLVGATDIPDKNSAVPKYDFKLWNLPVCRLKVIGDDQSFLRHINNVRLSSSLGSETQGKLQRTSGGIRVIPKDKAFNGKLGRFQVFCAAIGAIAVFAGSLNLYPKS